MKYLKKALVLCFIAGICATLIALVNFVTEPVIKANKEKKENDALASLINGATAERLENTNSDINGLWDLRIDEEIVAYAYSVSGKNAYGKVSVLYAIDSNLNVIKVVLTENTESYSTKLANHVQDAYFDVVSDLEDVDLACGATFGAKLVKELIEVGIDDLKLRLGK